MKYIRLSLFVLFLFLFSGRGGSAVPAGFSGQDRKPRPQEPVAPYPYEKAEIRFRNVRDSVLLAGELTIPEGEGPFPAAILVTGSGIQNRDEEISGHKPFLVLSDYLTRHGIMVLRYDDRGAGASEPGTPGATTEHFARDAEAAVEFLSALCGRSGERKSVLQEMERDGLSGMCLMLKEMNIRKKIDPARIGVIGHSEGGTIAFILAARNPRVKYMVSLAGPGVPGDSVLLDQQRITARAMGTPEVLIERSLQMNREYFSLIRQSEANDTVFAGRLREWLASAMPALPEKALERQEERLRDPWMYHFVKYDPQEAIRRVKVPVLAVNGTKDRQVSSRIHLPAIEEGLRSAGNRRYRIEEPEGLNHLFQECGTGFANEYGTIEQTISPVVLELVAGWISALDR